jgi:triosephosphate isomerase
MLAKKVQLSLDCGLNPIFLVQGKDNIIPQGVKIVAYEPVSAIGTGNPDTPESADMVAGVIKMNRSELMVLYGGSVKSVNVKGFTERSNIDGVLVGGASLDAQEFIKIIENA